MNKCRLFLFVLFIALFFNGENELIAQNNDIHSHGVASNTIKDSLTKEKQFKIGLYGGNGFYDIKQIKYAAYKSEGFQLSSGLKFSYKSKKKIGISIGVFYTQDKFILQNYDENAIYWEPPTMIKEMAYLSFEPQFTYDIFTKNKINLYALSGISIGFLVKGRDCYTGIYGSGYPYYMQPPVKQFIPTVKTAIIGSGIEYTFSPIASIHLESVWRYNFNEIAIYEENKTPFINIIVGLDIYLSKKNRLKKNDN